MDKGPNIWKHHTVKWLVLAVTAGVFANELLNGVPLLNNNSMLILIPLMLFQLRGILWENTYAKDLWEAKEELEMWRNKF